MRTPDDTARVTEQFVTYAETGQRLETRRGAATQTLVWLEDLPVGVIDGGVVHAIESDHLGTPRLAARLDTGATTWTWDFTGSSFGDHAPTETGLVLDLRYPGQHDDRHTGWHYNYFRDYEPGTGRYVQSDPIGLGGGVSTYGYALQNPGRFVDPTGEAAALAALCFIPGIGQVSCAAAAGGTLAAGGLCYATGTCQAMTNRLRDALQPRNDADCDEYECEKEWRDARERCRQLIYEQLRQAAGRRKKRSVTCVTGGYADVEQCARGFLGSTCKCNTLTLVGWMHGDQDEALPAPVG